MGGSVMASIINATTTGLTVTPDNSGQLTLSANGSTALTANTAGHCTFTNNFASVAGYPAYQCRAWVNFNGTGTVAIRASGNVSSITDNGVGTYTVNFTNSMPDVNYAAVVSGGTGAGNANNNNSPGNTTPTSSAFPIQTFDYAFTLADWAYNQVAIFR